MFLKIAHRGASGLEPENTLSSINKALALKADMIEIDVRLTKDKKVIVLHDDKVNRTTNGKGHVHKMTLAEIKKLDAGKGEKVPTLEEVLDTINKKTKINIEIKVKEAVRSTIRIINKYITRKKWKNSHFLISSFDHNLLLEVKKLNPKLRIGLIIAGIPDVPKLKEKYNPYSLNLNLTFVSELVIKESHKDKMKVFVWTVNDPEDIRLMHALNVDGLFSDFPDRL